MTKNCDYMQQSRYQVQVLYWNIKNALRASMHINSHSTVFQCPVPRGSTGVPTCLYCQLSTTCQSPHWVCDMWLGRLMRDIDWHMGSQHHSLNKSTDCCQQPQSLRTKNGVWAEMMTYENGGLLNSQCSIIVKHDRKFWQDTACDTWYTSVIGGRGVVCRIVLSTGRAQSSAKLQSSSSNFEACCSQRVHGLVHGRWHTWSRHGIFREPLLRNFQVSRLNNQGVSSEPDSDRKQCQCSTVAPVASTAIVSAIVRCSRRRPLFNVMQPFCHILDVHFNSMHTQKVGIRNQQAIVQKSWDWKPAKRRFQ